jgi:hypothetical protein
MLINFIEGKKYLISTKRNAIHYGTADKIFRAPGSPNKGSIRLKNALFKTNNFISQYSYNTLRIKNIKAYKQIELTEDKIYSSSKKELEVFLNV